MKKKSQNLRNQSQRKSENDYLKSKKLKNLKNKLEKSSSQTLRKFPKKNETRSFKKLRNNTKTSKNSFKSKTSTSKFDSQTSKKSKSSSKPTSKLLSIPNSKNSKLFTWENNQNVTENTISGLTSKKSKKSSSDHTQRKRKPKFLIPALTKKPQIKTKLATNPLRPTKKNSWSSENRDKTKSRRKTPLRSQTELHDKIHSNTEKKAKIFNFTCARKARSAKNKKNLKKWKKSLVPSNYNKAWTNSARKLTSSHGKTAVTLICQCQFRNERNWMRKSSKSSRVSSTVRACLRHLLKRTRECRVNLSKLKMESDQWNQFIIHWHLENTRGKLKANHEKWNRSVRQWVNTLRLCPVTQEDWHRCRVGWKLERNRLIRWWIGWKER